MLRLREFFFCRADDEMFVRLERTTDIKTIDDGIVGLKRVINKLKDQLAEFGTFESFLYTLSPDAWRQVQVRNTIFEASQKGLENAGISFLKRERIRQRKCISGATG